MIEPGIPPLINLWTSQTGAREILRSTPGFMFSLYVTSHISLTRIPSVHFGTVGTLKEPLPYALCWWRGG